MQGITTAIGGNCGLTPSPKRGMSVEPTKRKIGLDGWEAGISKNDLSQAKWLKKVERKGISVNFVPFIGHNVVRRYVMGEDFKRYATSKEIEEMKQLVEDGMKCGAY